MTAPALDTATAADFAPHIGTEFVLASGDEHLPPVTLALQQALPHGQAPEGARQPFSLLFAGPSETPLPQGTYSFCHPALEEVTIFVVPVRDDGRQRFYEAVFN